jgi:Ala-tRNA(Pro) deacylase
MMRYAKEDLIAYLQREGLSFTAHEHPAVFTVEEAQAHCGHIPGVHCKNLFLKDKKEKLWLLTVPDERVVDLKTLPDKIGAARISFGKPELLMEVLGVLPGSVSPLAVINDNQRRVTPVLDAWMMQQDLLNYHPLVNTSTLTMTPDALRIFMRRQGYEPVMVTL